MLSTIFCWPKKKFMLAVLNRHFLREEMYIFRISWRDPSVWAIQRFFPSHAKADWNEIVAVSIFTICSCYFPRVLSKWICPKRQVSQPCPSFGSKRKHAWKQIHYHHAKAKCTSFYENRKTRNPSRRTNYSLREGPLTIRSGKRPKIWLILLLNFLVSSFIFSDREHRHSCRRTAFVF